MNSVLTIEDAIAGAIARSLERSMREFAERLAALEARLPQFVSVAEAMQRTGLSRTCISEHVKSGRLVSKRVGRRVLIDLGTLKRVEGE